MDEPTTSEKTFISIRQRIRVGPDCFPRETPGSSYIDQASNHLLLHIISACVDHTTIIVKFYNWATTAKSLDGTEGDKDLHIMTAILLGMHFVWFYLFINDKLFIVKNSKSKFDCDYLNAPH